MTPRTPAPSRLRTLARLAVIVLTCVGVHAQVPRDAPAQPVSGTGAISGTVIAGGTGTAPARRARVSLDRVDGRMDGQSATTDDEGRFEFRNLPAGHFTISVLKVGYMRQNYGASRPLREGTPLALADGARVDNLVIRLVRGAAITGTVRDARGRPLPDVPVSALRISYTGPGERNIGLPSLGSNVTTDDRGMYRVWGLPAGEYLIAARPTVGTPGASDFIRLSTGDIDRLLNLARGINIGAATAPPPAAAADATTSNYAPVFHPGATSAESATTVVLASEAERTGVDIVVTTVPTARVGGAVVLPDGRSPGAVTVTLSASGELTDILSSGQQFLRPQSQRVDAEGHFEFQDVAPGRYTVLAKSTVAASPRGAPPPNPATSDPAMWAQASVAVNGAPVQLQLALQPALTVSGLIVFEGTTPPPTDVTALNVRLVPPGAGANLGAGPGTFVNSNGTFAIPGVTPGPYRLLELFQRRWSGWAIKSAMANGRSVLDGMVVAPGESIELVLTYADRWSELTGTLQDASGRPAPDYFIVVFPADPQLWRSPRRLASTRPATDGRYSLKGFIPGDYLLAALTDFQTEDMYAPSFLNALAPMALRVTIREGEVTRQDVAIGR